MPNSQTLILKWVSIFLILLSFLLRLDLLFIRYLDQDETEHLRGAFLISQGWLPYKDFFEVHPPLLCFLLAPLFCLGENLAIIFLGRGIMFFFTALILILVFYLARSLYNQKIAWIAATWLAFVLIFFEKTLEIRPDVPAICFFLGGLLLLIKDRGGQIKSRAFLSGILFSVSLLCTQKIIFQLVGVMIVLALFPFAGPRTASIRRLGFQRITLLLSGFLLPLLATFSYFWIRGGLSSFIYCNFIIILFWKHKGPALYFFLKRLVYQNPFFFFWGIWGWLDSGIHLFKSRDASEKSWLCWGIGLSGIAGLIIIPRHHRQIFALLVPIFSIFAAAGISRFLAGLNQASWRKRLLGFSLLLFSGPGLAGLALGEVKSWELCQMSENAGLALPLFAGGALIIYSIFILRKEGKGGEFALLLTILLITARPLNIMLHYDEYKNIGQVKAILTINRETSRGDRVLDGWPVRGVFRLPAYYYHYLDKGNIEMMTPEEKGANLLAVLREVKPKIITNDDYLESFSLEVREYIKTNYRIHPRESALLVRKSK